MTAAEITISKGTFNVTIYTIEVNDNFSNKLFLITPVQSKANQSSGTVDAKIVDLLRITRQLVVSGWVQTKAEKDNLISVMKGGGVDGGEVTLTYEGDSVKGFVEKMNFTEVAQDEPAVPVDPHAKYRIQLTFLEGVQI